MSGSPNALNKADGVNRELILTGSRSTDFRSIKSILQEIFTAICQLRIRENSTQIISSYMDKFNDLSFKQQRLLSLWLLVALKSVKEVAPIRLISDTAMLITSHNNLFIIKHITGLEASHSLHIHRTNNDACVLKEGETRLKLSGTFMDRCVLSGSGDSPRCN